VIMQHLHISEREAEITAALCAGDTLAQVAIRFGISPHTARSHLKSVYLKTGIHSKTELVRRVVSGPATASAFNGQGVAEAEPSRTLS
jgi:DNA-binding CsgD family transcriptional regulator